MNQRWVAVQFSGICFRAGFRQFRADSVVGRQSRFRHGHPHWALRLRNTKHQPQEIARQFSNSGHAILLFCDNMIQSRECSDVKRFGKASPRLTAACAAVSTIRRSKQMRQTAGSQSPLVGGAHTGPYLPKNGAFAASDIR